MNDLIDLCEELGWDERRIPVRMRLPGDKWGYCSSLAALYAAEDPRPGGATVDPRSGGIIGWRRFAEALGVGCQRTARRIQQGLYGESVLIVDGIPATTVNTANNIAYLHELYVSEVRRQARLGGWPPKQPAWDITPGSGHLANLQLIETHVRTERQESGAAQVWNLSESQL